MAGDIIMDHHGSSTDFKSGNAAYDAAFFDTRLKTGTNHVADGDAVNGWVGHAFIAFVLLFVIIMFAAVA